jgi:hypothetical protein
MVCCAKWSRAMGPGTYRSCTQPPGSERRKHNVDVDVTNPNRGSPHGWVQERNVKRRHSAVAGKRVRAIPPSHKPVVRGVVSEILPPIDGQVVAACHLRRTCRDVSCAFIHELLHQEKLGRILFNKVRT